MVEFDRLSPLEKIWLMAVANSDVVQAQQAAAAAISAPKDALFEALQEIAVVRYCRCFTLCNLPDGRRSRLPKRFELVEGVTKEFHQILMDHRHQIVAHSDMTKKDVVFVKTAENDFRTWTSGAQFNRNQLQMLVDQCHGVLLHIQREAVPLVQAELSDRRIGEEVLLRSLFQLPATE